MAQDDEGPHIYGMEFQARSLAAQSADPEQSTFMIGTQTLTMENNQIHVVTFSEETGNLTAQIHPHPDGELWHLNWSPHSMFSSVYNTIGDENNPIQKCTLWKLPEEGSQLERVSNVDTDGEVRICLFHPSDNRRLVTISDSNFKIWDLEGSPKESYSRSVAGKGNHKLSNAKWNPHESGATLAVLQETTIKGFDDRADSEAWSIEQAHSLCVRDLDYNRNKQHTLCSSGDDGLIRIWDLRALNSVLTLSGHTHWAWCVRYNPLHDVLMLSSGSDASGRLWWAGSAASEQSSKHEDGPLRQYTTMEDSVYASEWSGSDPWTFAMLSYDGRLIIHRVPKSIKYEILV